MSTPQRSNILAHACELYLSDGLDGFSMRKLAKVVGVTAPALYRHFDSKETLLLAVIGEAHAKLSRYLFRSLQASSAPERMQRAGQEYVRFALDHPELYEMIFVAPHHLGLEEYPEDILEIAGSTHQFWLDRIRELQEIGFLAPEDPEVVSMTMWAHAHGLLSIYLRGLCPMSREAFEGHFEASGLLMMKGIAGPAWHEGMAELAGAQEPIPGGIMPFESSQVQ